MTNRGLYFKQLRKYYRMGDMDSFGDLTEIIPLVEALSVTKDEEDKIILEMIKKRLFPLFVYSVSEEANVGLTRARAKVTMEQALFPLVGMRLLQDVRVICDLTNNPPSIIDSHDLWLDVYFQIPLCQYVFHIPMNMKEYQ